MQVEVLVVPTDSVQDITLVSQRVTNTVVPGALWDRMAIRYEGDTVVIPVYLSAGVTIGSVLGSLLDHDDIISSVAMRKES